MNIEKASGGIAQAITDGDAARLQRLTAKLVEYEPEETTVVLAKVRELILNSYGVTVDEDGELAMEVEEEDAEEDGEESEDSEGEDGNDDGVDEEEKSKDDFDEAAFFAMVDDRILLILQKYKLIPLEPAPEMPPPVVQTPAGAVVAEGTAAVVDIPSTVVAETPAATKTAADAEDDWSEG